MQRAYLFVNLLGLFALLGCSGAPDDRPDVAPVSGVVLLDGQPVEGAEVSFLNDNAPRAAIGRTDAEGRFQLTTFEPNDGAVPGEHKVIVLKAAAGPVVTDLNSPDYAKAMAESRKKKPTSEIPAKYSNPNDSGLAVTVPEAGATDVKLELTAE